MANLPLMIKSSGGAFNIRRTPDIKATAIAQIEAGMLFTQEYIYGVSGVNDRVQFYDYDQSCYWTDNWGDNNHEIHRFARMDGYFKATGATRQYSVYGALEHFSKFFPDDAANNHAQGGYHTNSGDGNWQNYADNDSFLWATSKSFMQHIYDSLKSKGWNGSSNFTSGNFAYRNGYYGVKLRYRTNYYDGSANLLGYCDAGSWAFFSWTLQPVTGSSRKDWVRVAGLTQSSDPINGTFLRQNMTTFIDADLDYTSSSPVWKGYNMSTMIDG